MRKASLDIKIDWSDLDMFGHVNNVAFFKYLQAARVHFCEGCGISALKEPGKPGFMVASSQCTFKRPLTFPGFVSVSIDLDWIKNSSFQLSYRLYSASEALVAEGSDVLVLYDHTLQSKINFHDSLRKVLESA
jgi:acyl-CoA thioester hydrolase